MSRHSISPTPVRIPPSNNPIHLSPNSSHCRIGRAAPVLLFDAPLVLDPSPAVTVDVALLVPDALDELEAEVVELEKALT
jgi:hypothetical protein